MSLYGRIRVSKTRIPVFRILAYRIFYAVNIYHTNFWCSNKKALPTFIQLRLIVVYITLHRK